jgi:hypothetical protein
VAAGSSDVAFRLLLHPKAWWLIVPFDLGGRANLAMVLDTGAPLSGISAGSRHALADRGLLHPVGRNRYLLQELSIEGQPVRDLVVRLSRRATAAGAEGILGLDFLSQFTEVHCHIRSLWLALRR